MYQTINNNEYLISKLLLMNCMERVVRNQQTAVTIANLYVKRDQTFQKNWVPLTIFSKVWSISKTFG